MIQAVIMAAGKSTRTYPLTLTKPKPLLAIANQPILAHQLDQLVGLIQEAILIVGYKSEQIRAHFGASYRGIALSYVEQREQFGTGHAAMQVIPLIKDRFLLMNGDDLYAREDIVGCLQYPYSLLSMEVPDPRQFGVLTVRDGLVKDLIEKPAQPESNLTSVGMYVFDRRIFSILENIPKSPRGEYEITDAVKQLAQVADVRYHVSTGYWIPVGFPWSLLTANDFLLERGFTATVAGQIEPGVRVEGRVALGENSIIRSGTVIQGNLHVGKNCVIEANCHFRGNTAIGDACAVGSATVITNSVIADQVQIAPFCHIAYSVIGSASLISNGVVTMSAPPTGATVTSLVKGQRFDTGRAQLGAMLADQTVLHAHVVTAPGVKLWPATTIPAGTFVQEDQHAPEADI